MHTAESLTSGVTTLTSPPLVYQRIKQVLDDPDSSMKDLAEVITVDPAITARLLRLVNSPFYGFQRKIETVNKAVNLLGTQQVHDLALATSVTALFKGMTPDHMNMARFWHYSVYCGLVARDLAKYCKLAESERLFVAGLLSNIGHLVIYEQLPDLAEQALENSLRDGTPLYQAERSLIGCDYAQVGAALIQSWSLPAVLRDSILYHIAPEQATENTLLVSLVHIARLLAAAADAGQSPEQILSLVAPQAWDITELDTDTITTVHQQADIDTISVVNSLFIGVR
ncbi:MAG: HDOD domain-containing protein [Gammaproteobacteria bacterium]|nr:HDOD domain-containing protein [Gammaproteobacteria bacterium]